MKTPIFDDKDGIKEQECLLMYDNSYEFYADVLKAFYKESLGTVVKMQQTLSEKKYDDYRILVHGLKGLGGAIGDDKLLQLATSSNALLKSGNITEGISYHDELINELKRMQELIKDRVLD